MQILTCRIKILLIWLVKIGIIPLFLTHRSYHETFAPMEIHKSRNGKLIFSPITFGCWIIVPRCAFLTSLFACNKARMSIAFRRSSAFSCRRCTFHFSPLYESAYTANIQRLTSRSTTRSMNCTLMLCTNLTSKSECTSKIWALALHCRCGMFICICVTADATDWSWVFLQSNSIIHRWYFGWIRFSWVCIVHCEPARGKRKFARAFLMLDCILRKCYL